MTRAQLQNWRVGLPFDSAARRLVRQHRPHISARAAAHFTGRFQVIW